MAPGGSTGRKTGSPRLARTIVQGPELWSLDNLLPELSENQGGSAASSEIYWTNLLLSIRQNIKKYYEVSVIPS